MKKKSDMFLIFAKNIARGYTLEPQNKKKCIPVIPQFYYIKVLCEGVYITRTCYYDVLDKNN